MVGSSWDLEVLGRVSGSRAGSACKALVVRPGDGDRWEAEEEGEVVQKG